MRLSTVSILLLAILSLSALSFSSAPDTAETTLRETQDLSSETATVASTSDKEIFNGDFTQTIPGEKPTPTFPIPKIRTEKARIVQAIIPAPPAVAVQEPAEPQVTRVQNPYPFPPFSTEALNTISRSALMNIICTVTDSGETVTGSGVFIDARGVIMTNAHIGQYVVLSEVSSDITCVGRTGAPAKPYWKLRVVFMPEKWVQEHAKDLRSPQPTGTGEHDYALLAAEPLTANDPSTPFTHVAVDVREAVVFQGDNVFLVSYPAGFIGGFLVQNNLNPATTVAQVRKLFTFQESTIDLLSLGGVILAQGGSSGGGVLNAWGRLVGIIVTTSDGKTTEERDLRAITVAHIDRSMRAHMGMSIAEFLDSNLQEHVNDFRVNKLNELAKMLTNEIPKRQ